jgi:hypothetical protein
VDTWAQTIRISPNARPYFLSGEELIWANPQLAGKIPNTLLKAFLYFNILLQAESPEHLNMLTQDLPPTTHEQLLLPPDGRRYWQHHS